jgi:hypothetical protein
MLLLTFASALAGCTRGLEEQIAATTKEGDDFRATLATRETEAAQLHADLAAVVSENAKLKQTPQVYLDAAADKGRAADTADTDEADQAAVAAYDDIVRRYPSDPLAAEARLHRNALVGRVERRAAARRRAQAEVVRQIDICTRNHATASSMSEDSLQYNYNNRIDMNAVMDGMRASKPYNQAATTAKARAEELLKGGVPDPDGELAKRVSGCD